MYPLNTNQQIHKLKSEIISYQNRIRIFKIYIYYRRTFIRSSY